MDGRASEKHAYEEAELGLRLLDAGYKLRRLNIPYFIHTSHTMPTFQMLKHRWKSGYYQAPGELLRCAWGKPYFGKALKMVRNEAIFSVYLIALFIAAVTFNLELFDIAFLPLLAFIVLKTVQNRSLLNGLQSVMNLAVLSAGLVKGLTKPVRDPLTPPDSKIIHE